VNRVMLTVLAPVIIGPLTFLAMQGMKRTSALVDTLPVNAKRVAVMLIATTLTMVGSATGVTVECDPDAAVSCLETLDKDAVKAIVGSALAFALHAIKQARKQA